MKFGGTSVGDAECIRRAAEIVANATRLTAVAVVVSAMSGVTNRLIAAAQNSAAGRAGSELPEILRKQHFEAAEILVANKTHQRELIAELDGIINEVANLCQGI